MKIVWEENLGRGIINYISSTEEPWTNEFFSCYIGGPPESKASDHNYLPKIGNNNVFREYCIVQGGTISNTIIGNDNYLMGAVHVGHDVIIGNNNVFGAGTILAGFVEVEDDVTFGLNCSVHQRKRIGRGSMVGMGAVVVDDIPEFAKVYGNPARVHGFNDIKMEQLLSKDEKQDFLEWHYKLGTASPYWIKS